MDGWIRMDGQTVRQTETDRQTDFFKNCEVRFPTIVKCYWCWELIPFHTGRSGKKSICTQSSTRKLPTSLTFSNHQASGTFHIQLLPVFRKAIKSL